MKKTHNNEKVGRSDADNAFGGAVEVAARHHRSAATRKMRPQAVDGRVQLLSRAHVQNSAVPVVQVAQHVARLNISSQLNNCPYFS